MSDDDGGSGSRWLSASTSAELTPGSNSSNRSCASLSVSLLGPYLRISRPVTRRPTTVSRRFPKRTASFPRHPRTTSTRRAMLQPESCCPPTSAPAAVDSILQTFACPAHNSLQTCGLVDPEKGPALLQCFPHDADDAQSSVRPGE